MAAAAAAAASAAAASRCARPRRLSLRRAKSRGGCTARCRGPPAALRPLLSRASSSPTSLLPRAAAPSHPPAPRKCVSRTLRRACRLRARGRAGACRGLFDLRTVLLRSLLRAASAASHRCLSTASATAAAAAAAADDDVAPASRSSSASARAREQLRNQADRLGGVVASRLGVGARHLRQTGTSRTVSSWAVATSFAGPAASAGATAFPPVPWPSPSSPSALRHALLARLALARGSRRVRVLRVCAVTAR